MKLTIQLAGQSRATIEIDKNDCSYADALEVFERTTGQIIKNYDFFAEGQKLRDLEAPIRDGEELVGVRSKNESAAKISIQLAGESKFTFETDDDDCDYAEALETFERLTSKSLKNYDVFSAGRKVRDLNSTVEDGEELVAIRSKNESA